VSGEKIPERTIRDALLAELYEDGKVEREATVSEEPIHLLGLFFC
jgi:hypothetical protein